MPTNLKNLLSRSRSRNELKGSRTDKEDFPGGCSCHADMTSPPGHEINSPATTCQCHSSRPGSPGTLSRDANDPPLRRDTSSRSLFSLPAEGLVSSRPTSPDTTVTSPATLTMRKCETVLTLSTFSGSHSTGSSPGHVAGSASSHPLPSPTKVKAMKDRILSTSSSALSTLLQTTNKSKLFSGWKFGGSASKPPTSQHPQDHHDHHHQPTSPAPPPPPPLLPTNGFLLEPARSQVSVYEPPGTSPLTPSNRLRRHGSVTNTHHPYWLATQMSRTSSVSSVLAWNAAADNPAQLISCRLCLCDVSFEDTIKFLNCSCRYCKDCVTAYVSFEIEEGAYDIACPDATCEQQGILSLDEIEALVPSHIVEKHKKFRSFKDVETNCELMWCPTRGCETICKRKDPRHGVNGPSPGTIPIIQCPKCQHVYCTECRLPIHADLSCDAYRQKLLRQGKLALIDEEPFASCDSIKKCPFCHVPIEKDSGCAQMMCKRCKHVFCWYCLSSLDDDFLLRHYDKGPCKNKLGHSRASVVWHRTQVIGIFAGFGLLVLLASPLLILAAPCLLCCRCRYCSSHLDPPDDSPVSI